MDLTAAVRTNGDDEAWAALFSAPKKRRRRGAPDVWQAVSTVEDPRPQLRASVEARFVPVRWDDDYWVVGDPERRKHFTLEPWEWELAQRMDGQRSLEELVALRLEQDGVLDPDAVRDLIALLRHGDMLEGGNRDVWRTLAEATTPPRTLRQRVIATLASLKVEWTGAEALVAALYRTVLRPLFVPWLQPILIAVAVAGLAAFGWMAADGRLTLSQGSVTSGVFLIVLSLFMTFVHELGHAAYLVHRRRRVYSAGFLLYFGSPAFFVDSTDGLLLERRDRIRQAFAGPYYEMVLGGAIALVALALPAGGVADTMHVFILLLYFGVFLNLIPLLELDGYWIFAELLESPTLRSRSFEFVRHELPTRLWRRQPLRRHEVWFTFYVVVGTAFTIWSVWVAIVFWQTMFGPMVSGLWNGGTTSRVILVVGAAALAGPAVQGAAKLTRNLLARATQAAADVRFRFETSWRVEAALLLDDSPVFGDLPEETLSDLSGRLRRRRIDPGEAVFRQGDRADAFYVVRTGTLQVVSETDQDTTVMAILQRGDTFGELGLLGHAVRQATVRATAPSEVFVVLENDFDRLLRTDASLPTVAPTLTALATLGALPPFARLTSARLAALHRAGTWLDVAPGTAVVSEGEVGDAFYVISSGQAEVRRKRRKLGTLGAGDAFGELALQSGEPRAATVTAVTPLRLFQVPPTAFRRFLAADARPRAVDEPEQRVMSH